MMAFSSRRKARLNLRRKVQAYRYFDVEFISADPLTEKLTCRTCGKSETVVNEGVARTLAKKLSEYRSRVRAHGLCKHCTKAERDRRYPLPKE